MLGAYPIASAPISDAGVSIVSASASSNLVTLSVVSIAGDGFGSSLINSAFSASSVQLVAASAASAGDSGASGSLYDVALTAWTGDASSPTIAFALQFAALQVESLSLGAVTTTADILAGLQTISSIPAIVSGSGEADTSGLLAGVVVAGIAGESTGGSEATPGLGVSTLTAQAGNATGLAAITGALPAAQIVATSGSSSGTATATAGVGGVQAIQIAMIASGAGTSSGLLSTITRSGFSGAASVSALIAAAWSQSVLTLAQAGSATVISNAYAVMVSVQAITQAGTAKIINPPGKAIARVQPICQALVRLQPIR